MSAPLLHRPLRRTSGFSCRVPRSSRSVAPAVASLVLAASLLAAQAPPGTVRVYGTVLDSLTGAPLTAATVRFAHAGDPGSGTLAAGTDAEGKFEVTLSPGPWLVGIEHAHFDSLGVTLPARRVEIPARTSFRLPLATASARTLTRAYCGANAHDADVAIVGTVRAAGSDAPLDSTDVLVQWSDLRFARGGVVSSAPTIAARTDGNGWFVLCGPPARAELVTWAERGPAATGLVEAQTSDGPLRLDLWLDPASTRSARAPASADAAGAPSGAARRRPSVRAGGVRYRVQVTDASGKPVPGARARVVGHRFATGEASGSVELDSLPGGSQTFEVRALGYVPLTRELNLAASNAVPDTVVLTSAKALLDTVRVSAGRVYSADGNGFELRRRAGIGSYITRAEVDRFQPASLASLLQARSGVSIKDTPLGDQVIRMAAPWGGTCTPTVWVDGDLVVHPAGPSAGALMTAPPTLVLATSGPVSANAAAAAAAAATNGGTPGAPPPEPAGFAELSWLVSPSEIEGVEIYRRPMEIPAQFVVGGYQGCGALVIWTRWRTAMPAEPR